ncbi:hypothetical protein J3A83DRAFT_3811895 [Scleroderma citrinum]
MVESRSDLGTKVVYSCLSTFKWLAQVVQLPQASDSGFFAPLRTLKRCIADWRCRMHLYMELYSGGTSEASELRVIIGRVKHTWTLPGKFILDSRLSRLRSHCRSFSVVTCGCTFIYLTPASTDQPRLLRWANIRIEDEIPAPWASSSAGRKVSVECLAILRSTCPLRELRFIGLLALLSMCCTNSDCAVIIRQTNELFDHTHGKRLFLGGASLLRSLIFPLSMACVFLFFGHRVSHLFIRTTACSLSTALLSKRAMLRLSFYPAYGSSKRASSGYSTRGLCSRA